MGDERRQRLEDPAAGPVLPRAVLGQADDAVDAAVRARLHAREGRRRGRRRLRRLVQLLALGRAERRERARNPRRPPSRTASRRSSTRCAPTTRRRHRPGSRVRADSPERTTQGGDQHGRGRDPRAHRAARRRGARPVEARERGRQRRGHAAAPAGAAGAARSGLGLLRQRKALRNADLNPDAARLRDEETVDTTGSTCAPAAARKKRPVARASFERRGRDLNPRSTFQHLRDFSRAPSAARTPLRGRKGAAQEARLRLAGDGERTRDVLDLLVAQLALERGHRAHAVRDRA